MDYNIDAATAPTLFLHNATVTTVTPYAVLSPADNATVLRLAEARQAIFVSYIWVVFLLGFPGNVACVLTVLSMHALSTATLYVALLAVVDALSLLLKLVFHQLAYHRAYFGHAGCKATVLSNVLNCFANWMLVLVCLERFLAVCWPLKKAVFFTKTRAWVIAVILLAALTLLHSQLFVFYISDPTGRACGFSGGLGVYMRVWYWVSSVVFSFAPFVLISVFTSLIVLGLRRFRAARKSVLRGDHQRNGGKSSHGSVSSGKQRADSARLERAMSVMMSVAAGVFLVLTLPTCVYVIFFDPWGRYPPVEQARWKLFEQVAYVLSDLNHAINFYLYFLSAGKFRAQFKNMVLCRRGRLRRLRRSKQGTEATSFTDHTQYSRANSNENLPMTKV